MRKFPLFAGAIILLAGLAGAAAAHDSGKSEDKPKASAMIGIQNDDEDDDRTNAFQASLRGSNEVPAVSTRTKGGITIRFHDEHFDGAPFVLTVKKGQDVTMAHLHCAPAGQNGPVVVTLLGEIPGGFDVSGRLMKSDIENDNINTANGATCPTPISDLGTLQTAMEKGEIYANVHTVAHPGGEIRGQLHVVAED